MNSSPGLTASNAARTCGCVASCGSGRIEPLPCWLRPPSPGPHSDGNGRPIAGVLIEVFHALAKGEYTRERAMDEPLSRLFGFMRTGADGRYEFHTIRPGGYAMQPVPQHIHLVARARGYKAHLCRSTCQLVFADDPRMTLHWRAWAKDGGNPVLDVTRTPDGTQRATYDFVLDEE